MAGKLRRQDDRVPRRGGRGAGGADGAVEGGRGRRRHARADLARGRATCRPSTTSTRPTRSRSTAPRRRRTPVALRRPRAAGRGRQPRLPAHRRGRGRASCARSSTQAKPVAAICHGPWTLIDAGVVNGRTLTSWPSLQTDLRNAGATWVDEEVHVDAGPRDARATLTTCPRSAPSSSRSSARASTRASAARGRARDRVDAAPARRDPRHRRHARRHELPPRDRVVPGVPAARRDAAAVPHPPPHRDGRRPAGRRPRRRGLRARARRRVREHEGDRTWS